MSLIAERTETNVPIELIVGNNSGGVTGLTATVAIRDADTNDSWLDFADGTFKTSGWTTRKQSLTEASPANAPGVYRYSLDLSAVTLPATDNLVAEFETSGSVTGVTNEIIQLVDTFKRIAPAGLMHENSVIDGGAGNAAIVTNASGLITAARVRQFATKAAADAATKGAADGADSEVHRWTITATYTVAGGSIPQDYKLTKDL